MADASRQARLREAAERSRLAANTRNKIAAILQAAGKRLRTPPAAAMSAVALLIGIGIGAWIGEKEPVNPAPAGRNTHGQVRTIDVDGLRLRLDNSLWSLDQDSIRAAKKNSSSPGK
jgi:hypothetical protein